ncbi:hypothetical protein ACM6RI_05195 [Trueperella pyogenes]
MTIEISVSSQISANPTAFDIEVAEHVLATTWIGMDLTLLGATVPVGFDDVVERLNFPRLAASVRAAQAGGIDFVTLDASFLTTTETNGREHAYDAAETAAKLAEISTAGIFAGVEADPAAMTKAIELLSRQHKGWAGLTIPLHTGSDFDGIKKVANLAARAGVKVTVIITDPRISAERAAIVASIADVVRLRVREPYAARSARFAIRAAGKELGKDIPVLLEIGIVISGSVAAAEERALLIEDMNGTDLFSGIVSVLGTVYNVADAVESYVGLGAADGVILIPASLPTDLASVLKGVLPLIEARAKLEQA